MKVREAAVSGSFYPREEALLLKQLDGFLKPLPNEKKSRVIVAPHAGYVYSGKIAALAFNALQKAESFVVLSPNHTGLGEIISISDADGWETPLGKIAIDAPLRQRLLNKLEIEPDDLAHIQEHSAEVQLPFIQFLFPEAKVLPITLMTQDLGELERLGNALYWACSGKNIGVIASSDFSHFISESKAKELDMQAIWLIEKMDFAGFHALVLEKNLSICGFGPIVTAMVFAKKTGLQGGRLLKYGSSAAVTKDRENVVGYAAIKFE